MIKLSAENGLDNITTKKIAAATDIAEGTIYRYFQSKDEFLAVPYLETLKSIDTALQDADYTQEEDIVNLLRVVWNEFLNFWVGHKEMTSFVDQYRHSSYYLSDFFERKRAEYEFSTIELLKSAVLSMNSKFENLDLFLAIVIDTTITLAKSAAMRKTELSDTFREKVFIMLVRVLC